MEGAWEEMPGEGLVQKEKGVAIRKCKQDNGADGDGDGENIRVQAGKPPEPGKGRGEGRNREIERGR